MTLRIGQPKSKRAFTLIELILVMAILVIVVGVTYPMLSKFFTGRTLESEGRRFLTLTRYGQSRAVAEGYPMVLWINPKAGTYGLEAEAGFLDRDDRAVDYKLGEKLEFEVTGNTVSRFALTQEQQNRRRTPARNANPEIKFMPDGSVDVMSPESVAIWQGRDHALYINQTENRLNYEVDTEPLARRF